MNERALLFTDVVASTALIARVGDESAAAIWAEHDRCARQLLAQHAGVEIDRTDGFFLLFDQVGDAAGFALAYHREIAEIGLAARVGLHHAAVTLRPNPSADIARGAKPIEVEGLAKPLAARIMSLARGGQTLLSDAARNALGDAPAGTQLQAHGHYRLKGFEEPQALFELGSESSAFTPPVDTEKAYRVVLVDELWRPLREVRHNLAPERDAFIGRSAELRQLALRLESGVRLLTALGVGGTGKTRLVRRYGLAWLGEWPGGVYFCDLSEARGVEGICFAVASALDVPLGKDDPVVQLGHAIAGRGRCLVILDNFEQVVQHAPSSLARWLDRAGEASFVVTSRERLHLNGEQVLPIEPLELGREAIELFDVRARSQQPGFALDADNRSAVAEVVKLLDGLPLAIELAAARVRVLSPAQILQRMKDRFVLLVGARGAAARQATLKAAIDWSWELLTPWEQAALAQCSVFEGGFTLEAAEAVLDLSKWPQAPPAIDVVQALVDKSLVRSWSAEANVRLAVAEPYFGMYISIRDYAAQQLSRGGANALLAVEHRHGRYFASYAAVERWRGAAVAARLKALIRELDNLVAATRRAVQRADGLLAIDCFRAAWEAINTTGPFAIGVELGRLATSVPGSPAAARACGLADLALAVRRSGQTQEAALLLVQAMAHALDSADLGARACVITQQALLEHHRGDVQRSLALFQEALALHRQTGDRRDEGVVLANLADVFCDLSRMDEARAAYAQALALHRETGNRRAEGILIGNLGTLCYDLGRFAEARVHYDTALAIDREVGNRSTQGVVLGNLANLHCSEGRFADALACNEAALAIARDVGSRRDEGIVLGQLADLQQGLGQFERAHAQYETALSIHREVGNRRNEAWVCGRLANLLVKEQRLSEAMSALQTGEALIRSLGDRLELANILTTRGTALRAAGDRAGALQALEQSEAIAAELGVGAESELVRELAALRASLA